MENNDNININEEPIALTRLNEEEAKKLVETKNLGKVEWDYKPHSFILVDKKIKKGDWVVVQSPDLGEECLKIVSILPISVAQAQKEGFKEIFSLENRLATDREKDIRNENIKLGKEITSFVQQLASDEGLEMKIILSALSLDGNKVLIVYTADNRIDFRNMLKIIAYRFRLHIEFRQIGPRDRARIVGGIGICGLPLCCKAFITAFDTVSINVAKNQYLSLNIPKLSGQCGKLMCCLMYENETYNELKALYPSLGSKIILAGKEYEVTNVNIISETITVTDGNSYETYSYLDYKKAYEKIQK